MAIRSPERACARASVHPHTSPYIRISLGSMVSISGEKLPVPQLADVEVVGLAVEPGLGALPAEEDVAGCLHQPLADDHPLALVGVCWRQQSG